VNFYYVPKSRKCVNRLAKKVPSGVTKRRLVDYNTI
jgi:hypothetical protein